MWYVSRSRNFLISSDNLRISARYKRSAKKIERVLLEIDAQLGGAHKSFTVSIYRSMLLVFFFFFLFPKGWNKQVIMHHWFIECVKSKDNVVALQKAFCDFWEVTRGYEYLIAFPFMLDDVLSVFRSF